MGSGKERSTGPEKEAAKGRGMDEVDSRGNTMTQ